METCKTLHIHAQTFPLEECTLQVHLIQDDQRRILVHMLSKNDGEWGMTVVGREQEGVYESFSQLEETHIHSLLRDCASHINAALAVEETAGDLPVFFSVNLGWGALGVSRMDSVMSLQQLGKQATKILSKLTKLISGAGNHVVEDPEDNEKPLT